jgi:hypothetical protein
MPLFPILHCSLSEQMKLVTFESMASEALEPKPNFAQVFVKVAFFRRDLTH